MTQQIIERRLGAGGESAYVGGTRVRVSDVARLYKIMHEEVVAERIKESIPHLTTRQIRAALDYWHNHPQEIESEISEEEELLSKISSDH